MGRWEAGANLRLREAALNLFSQNGFDQVTVEQIAEVAGVTERTFFRHFPTKEDVFFSDSSLIIGDLVGAIRNQPVEASARQLVQVAMTALAEVFEPNRETLRIRAQVIASVPALRERELLKQHAIASAVIDELVDRRIPRPRAAAIAGVGMVIYQVAFAAWVTDNARKSLRTRIEQALDHVATDLALG